LDTRGDIKRRLKAGRRSSRRRLVFVLALLVAGATGTVLWFVLQPPRTARLTLALLPFDRLPGWNSGDPRPALAAFVRSCASIRALPPAQSLGGAGYAGNARDWVDVCGAARGVAPDAMDTRAWFEKWFAPFAVGRGSSRSALFTGYYEPEIFASRVRHGAFATPIYGRPGDLVMADLGLFRPDLVGLHVTGRVADHRLVPFPTRAEIDAHGLPDAPVLLYANDPVAVFFLHIQGSGRARLDDGTMLRLAYAGQSGRPYTPIGRTLIDEGELDRAHMSMQAIRGWLKAHPGKAGPAMESDESYVFFRELPVGDSALGSPGSEGVALTPETSIAVDPAFHALGVPMFVVTKPPAIDPTLARNPFARLCIAQDTGGAIKGASRADIFWGYGARAEAVAGHMKSEGSLYVLLPKPLAGRIASQFAGAQS
jgi:membrane-bound lytic murein transglycosylase A